MFQRGVCGHNLTAKEPEGTGRLLFYILMYESPTFAVAPKSNTMMVDILPHGVDLLTAS